MIFSSYTVVLSAKLFFKFISKARRLGKWVIELKVSLEFNCKTLSQKNKISQIKKLLLKYKDSKGKQKC